MKSKEGVLAVVDLEVVWLFGGVEPFFYHLSVLCRG